ncbi:MAG: proteasome accessory factor PafA2 family protein [Planctomycetaceae bacterium]|nr:proteasome accessory factor PafA2 family protein [Planctomycetaceae bacterium]
MDNTVDRFLMSTETEYLSVFDHPDPEKKAIGLSQFLNEIYTLAPALPGPQGFFNPYGRIYIDGSHLEFAAAECGDPFTLVQILEAQQRLMVETANRMREVGWSVTLANCNHDGVLKKEAATWGSHGNYLTDEHPTRITERILPFLVTRVYAGAGGVHWPSGDYLSGVRLNFLQRTEGGSTTQERAIHSTARDEPLTSNPARYGWRYHTILGDGLRSHFSLLLRFGVTALVLQAIQAFPDALKSLPVKRDQSWKPQFWIRSLRQFNRLRRCDDGLTASKLAIHVQRVYLSLVDRYVTLADVPPWAKQVVTIWETTLDALERRDHEWLAQRLDPWIKYAVFNYYLDIHGCEWKDLRKNYELAEGLALLNQDYHDLTAEESLFQKLEDSGSLNHRIGEIIPAGEEPLAYVPEFGTRATRRARFIKANAYDERLTVSWEQVVDDQNHFVLRLDDPCSSTSSIVKS